MQYLYYSFLFAFLYVYAGLGLTLVLCPEGLKKHALFLSPMVGYCYLTLAGWLCYSLNLKGTDVYAPALLILPSVFLYYALTNRRRQTEQQDKLINVESIAPIAIGIIAFLVISMPFLQNGGKPTSMSLGNNDIALYASISRYLKEFPRSETVEFLATKDADEFKSYPSLRFGYCLSIAVPSSVFSLETYQLQNIGTHVFFLFSVLMFYALAREVFRYNCLPAIGVTALYGLSPIMCYTAYEGFGPQIIATGLTLCLILLHLHAVNKCRKISEYYPYLALGILFNWGVIITYRHMLPVICALILSYVLLTGLYMKSRALVLNWGLFLVMTLALAFLLSPSRAKSLVAYLIFMGGAEAGWDIPLISPDGFFGLTLDSVRLQPHEGIASLVLSLPFAGIVTFGLVNVYKKDKSLFLVAASSVLLILMGYILLAIPSRAQSVWGGYRSYKLLSFFLPIGLLGSLVLFRSLEFALKNWTSYVLPLLLAALVGANVFSCYAIVKQMSKTRVIVTKDLADLRRVESDERVESINIRQADFWETLWQANFLMRKKLYFETTTYYAATKLDGQWDLRPAIGSGKNDLIHVKGFDQDKTDIESGPIAVNPSYILVKTSAGSTLEARFEKGWYTSEGTHIWTGANSNEASISLQSARDNLAIDLRAKYWPLDRNNRMSLYLNGSKVADCPDSDSCQANGMILSAGQNVLTFKTALPATIPSSADLRRLGYAFTSIDISSSESAAMVHNASSPGYRR